MDGCHFIRLINILKTLCIVICTDCLSAVPCFNDDLMEQEYHRYFKSLQTDHKLNDQQYAYFCWVQYGPCGYPKAQARM